jgi:hypothetical protein
VLASGRGGSWLYDIEPGGITDRYTGVVDRLIESMSGSVESFELEEAKRMWTAAS